MQLLSRSFESNELLFSDLEALQYYWLDICYIFIILRIKVNAT